MVAEKYKKYLLVTTLIITIFVFAAGILVGSTFDTYQTDELLLSIRQNELEAQSFLVEQQFVETFGGQCDSMISRVENVQKSIADTGRKLTLLENSRKYEGAEDFEYLKNKHLISKIQFFTLLKNFEETCGVNYDIILFFYQVNHSESITQGFSLDELADKNPDVVILSIDKDYEKEPLVSLLVVRYNVEKAPTLIINDEKIEGFTSTANIESYIN
ncbi:MAG: thioredoxin family protein [Nanoarchaeota archaeon]